MLLRTKFAGTRQKPRSDVRIDWNNPLAGGLTSAFLFAEPPSESKTFKDTAIVSGGYQTSPGTIGRFEDAAYFDATTNNQRLNSGQKLLIDRTSASDYTIYADIYHFASTPLSIGNRFGTEGGGTENFHKFLNNQYQIYLNGAGLTSTFPISLPSVAIGKFQRVILTKKTNIVKVWVDGRLDGTATLIGDMAAAEFINFGADNSERGQLAIRSSFMWLGRGFTDLESQEITTDPYQLFVPTGLQSYFLFGQSGVINQLSGTSAGTSTASGTLSVEKPLTGTSAGTSTATGSLEVGKSLAGQSDGTGGASGSLIVTKNLIGRSDASGTQEASLSLTKILTGQSSASLAAQGALSNLIDLILSGGQSANSSYASGIITASTAPPPTITLSPVTGLRSEMAFAANATANILRYSAGQYTQVATAMPVCVKGTRKKFGTLDYLDERQRFIMPYNALRLIETDLIVIGPKLYFMLEDLGDSDFNPRLCLLWDSNYSENPGLMSSYGMTIEGSISAFASGGTGLTTATATGSNLKVGQSITITGTGGLYDGKWAISAATPNTFTIPASFTSAATATWQNILTLPVPVEDQGGQPDAFNSDMGVMASQFVVRIWRHLVTDPQIRYPYNKFYLFNSDYKFQITPTAYDIPQTERLFTKFGFNVVQQEPFVALNPPVGWLPV